MSETQAPVTTTKLRWARAQRFRLTGKGAEGLKAWRAAMEKVQGADGRTAFDAIRIVWAKDFAVEPEDGLLVSELSGAPLRLEDLLKSLEDTGTSRDQVKAGLERLHTAGLVEPVAATAG
jgi:hypothetical protein